MTIDITIPADGNNKESSITIDDPTGTGKLRVRLRGRVVGFVDSEEAALDLPEIAAAMKATSTEELAQPWLTRHQIAEGHNSPGKWPWPMRRLPDGSLVPIQGASEDD